MDIVGTSSALPSSCFSACYGAVGIEADVYSCFVSLALGVLTIFVAHKLIVACYLAVGNGSLCSDVVVGDGLAVELERSSHKPSLVVEEELMNAHLMTLALVGEA